MSDQRIPPLEDTAIPDQELLCPPKKRKISQEGYLPVHHRQELNTLGDVPFSEIKTETPALSDPRLKSHNRVESETQRSTMETKTPSNYAYYPHQYVRSFIELVCHSGAPENVCIIFERDKHRYLFYNYETKDYFTFDGFAQQIRDVKKGKEELDSGSY